MNNQSVILVNDRDEPVGEMEKMEVHRKGLLHRAFSVFIFNKKGELLLQKRALHKYHSGGLWTNTCCSHPAPGEELLAAASRRLQQEMGFTTKLEPAFSFIYNSEFGNGLTEHEFDHVFIGKYDGIIMPEKDEVSEYLFLSIPAVRELMQSNENEFTSWFKIAFPKVEEYLAIHPL